MVMTRTRKHELTDAEIAAVKLSNRRVVGEYVAYTALSRDGHTEYTPILRSGCAINCDCPATVKCRHMFAAEFEEAWSAPVAKTEQVWHDDDTTAHVEDSIRSGEFEYEVGEMEAILNEIIADELVQAEVASLPDIDSDGFFDEIWAMQAEKARKLAAQAAYREAWPEDFSYYSGAA